MKRMLCLFAGVFFLLCVPVYADAADDGYDELREEIISCMETGERLNISEYQLTKDQLDEIYLDLFHRGFLPWYADSLYEWTGSPDGTVSIISIRDLRKRGFSEDSYERAIAEVIAAACHEGMSDVQKALSVHDYLVARIEYRYYDSTNNGYHALVLGQTQCYGYAQAFLRIMERLNIPCKIVICDDVGNGDGHAWNVVQLDGEWYHLDLTWNDSLPDAPGQALHTYFLKTDMEFKWKYDHGFGWETETDCKDKTYSRDTVWEDLKSPVVFLDADTMILRKNNDVVSSLYAVDVKTGEEKLLYSMPYDDIELGGKYYYGYGTGLYLWNGRVWFNSSAAVYSIALDGTDLKTEYTYDIAANQRYIFGFAVSGGKLNISTVDLDYDVRKLEVELADSDYHTHDYKTAYISATCETEGYQLHTCSCGITYQTERRDPLGHALVEETIDNGIRYTCQNCDYTYDQIDIAPESEPTEHTEIADNNHSEAIPLPVIVAVSTIILALVLLLIKIKRR